MKRFSLHLCAVLALVGVTSFATVDDSMHFGVQAGVNFGNTSISPTPAVSPGSRTGFLVGVTGDFPIASGFSIAPELNYAQKGNATTVAGVTATNKLDYLEIPVNGKYTFGNFSGFRPYVAVGPYLGFLISAKSNAGGGAADVDNKANTKSMDIGLDFGAGASYVVSENTQIFLALKYGLGLTNVVDTSVAANAGLSAKNNVFNILAGVLF